MRHGRWRFLVGALVPALVLHAVFVLSPYVQAFYLSLTDWTGVAGEARFVGWATMPASAATPCSSMRSATTR
ncbi:hypothetical protein NKG94_50595 [Micromonospora sp. M12]